MEIQKMFIPRNDYVNLFTTIINKNNFQSHNYKKIKSSKKNKEKILKIFNKKI